MIGTDRSTPPDNKARRSGSRLALLFADLPISWKLLLASVTVGAIATGLAIHGLRRTNALNERLTRLVDYSAAKVKVAALLKHDLITVTRAEKNLIFATTLEQMDRYASTIDEALATMSLHHAQLAELAGERDREALAAFTNQWNEWQKVHRDVRVFAQLNSDARIRELALGNARESFLKLQTALMELAEREIEPSSAEVREEPITPSNADTQNGNSRVLAQQIVQLISVCSKIQSAEKQLMLADSEEELAEYDRQLVPLKESALQQISSIAEAAGGQLEAQVRDADAALQSYLGVLAEMRAVSSEKGNFFVLEYADEVGGPLANDCEILLDQIIRENEQDLDRSRDESRRSYLAARNALLMYGTIGIVLSVMVTYFTGQHIASNIGRLADYTRTLEDTGDLSLRAPRIGNDEVGQLAQSFDHLRASLHRQTSELAQLNRALEHKSKEMEQFVYTVSHDLSSPLVSCKGLIGLIKEDMASGDHQEVLASINRLDGAVDQLRRIIEDLLKLSRIGRKPLHLVEVDVEDLVRQLVGSFQNRLKQANAEIAIESPLPKVIADATDLTRAFDNLVSNAIKYGCTPENRTITIGGQRVAGETRFFVRDQGPGIDPRYHSQIFRLFQRLETGKPGTGVGLASVEKIMRMHNGRCWVESDVGRGATFWLAFPNKVEPQHTPSDFKPAGVSSQGQEPIE